MKSLLSHTRPVRSLMSRAVMAPCWVLLLCLATPLVHEARAAAPAGTLIGNQASATYSDGSAVTRTVTSNTVFTLVQQASSVSLAAPTAKTISPGGQVYYPHTVVNTGNGTDSFTLSASGTGTGTFNFSSVTLYADSNGDGVPDNNVAITSTGQLAAGQMFKFVAAGVVPSTAVAGNTNVLTLNAVSTFNAAGVGSTTVADTTTVTSQGVIASVQALDLTVGPSPSTGRTITLTYTNTGNSTVTNLTLSEAIPSGMTYVANSARWSGTGSAVVLTDADKTDGQSGIVYDQNVTTSGAVTAVIASVTPGASGTLSFQVNVNAGLPAGANAATAATATFGYHDGASTIPARDMNTVQYTVLASAAVTMAGSTVAGTTQGGVVNFTNRVTNTGNGPDSFDITAGTSNFPVGTTFQFFQADGVTPLVDTNGNGIPDTGPLAKGAYVDVVIRATLPSAYTGTTRTVQGVATSRLDPTKVATATNTLTTVTGNTVDLTHGGGLGANAGPEALPVSTLTLDPGATSSITLVVGNGSSVADTFNLQASTDSTFGSVSLPAGWSVVFKDANGAIIDNTGVLNAGGSKTVTAHVSVPATSAPGTTQVYFRAASPTTGAKDILHDAVTVNTLRGLALNPNHSGQLTAGGTMVYSHIVANTGNVLEGDGVASNAALTVANTGAGFTSVVHWDKNNDGVLDAADPVVTSLADLAGGSNGASVAAGLSSGETARLFIKVTAPSGAAAGVADVATLTMTTTGVISAVAAPPVVLVADSSSVIASQVTLVITQALDAACDGTADTAFSVNTIVAGALPGGCIRYEVTATNSGPVAVTALTVSNATPAYTTYHATVAASATAGTVTAPANGSAGTVQTAVPTLASGGTVVLRFGVRIEP